jgi:hypothetical protein
MRPASFELALLGLALVALPSHPADPAPFRWDDRWASFGQFLRKLREAAGLSRAELARKAGVPASS